MTVTGIRKMIKRKKFIRGCGGFTLIELMLTLLISSLIVAAIYAAYTAQQRVATAQEAVVEMQQNLRAATMMMSGDFRMAGYGRGDGTKDTSCNVGATGPSVAPGVLTVTPTQIDFSMDLNRNGDCADTGENLSYFIFNSGSVQKLLRWDNNYPPWDITNPPLPGDEDKVTIAENIEKLEFAYLDAGGIPTTEPDDIRTVQIYLLAKAGRSDSRFTNNRTYPTPPSGASWAVNDHSRRRFLFTTIVCRNMGF